MYTGRLIENLMKTVERAEQRVSDTQFSEEKLAEFYAISHFELTQLEPGLAGVA
ncbi:MAG TPA: hypothetical protein VFB28_00515 [Terriglobales bacterium]|jgi:hypothetical protein|nr:hypothetical protein [Terriglobales bacterium]